MHRGRGQHHAEHGQPETARLDEQEHQSKIDVALACEVAALFPGDVELVNQERIDLGYDRPHSVDVLIKSLRFVIEFDDSYSHQGSAWEKRDRWKTQSLHVAACWVVRVRQEPLTLLEPKPDITAGKARPRTSKPPSASSCGTSPTSVGPAARQRRHTCVPRSSGQQGRPRRFTSPSCRRNAPPLQRKSRAKPNNHPRMALGNTLLSQPKRAPHRRRAQRKALGCLGGLCYAQEELDR